MSHKHKKAPNFVCRSTLSALLLLSLAACGGAGGIDNGGTTTQPAQNPPPAPPPGSSAPTLSLSANPTVVQTGGASTLAWSTANATSCTASNGWSGTKGTSGNQSTGALSGTRSFTLACSGSGGSVTKTVTVTVTSSTPPPPPTGAVGGYPMPSLDDERNTYRLWSWTWTASQEPGAVTEPIPGYSVGPSDVDVRNDTEADDLWNYLMMYRRTGSSVYLNRAQAWLQYFKQDYVTDVVNDDAVNNHLYGWGLIAWYEHTCAQGACDLEALNVAEQIGALAEQAWSGAKAGQTPMANYGARRGGRPLLLATRLADVTKKQRWIDLRDRFIDLWLNSPDWDPHGFYEIGGEDTDAVAGSGAYAAGYRVQSAFQLGILSEAFDYAYRSTGRTELRDRIVAMANYIDAYGLDPTYQYAGSYFGVSPTGAVWHNHFANCGSSCTFADSSYTTSLVNILVRGYKYTGDTRYLARAKYFFNRGTKTTYGKIQPEVGDSVVHHFMDTKFSSDQFYLSYNKGELQYTYLIFENGGQPQLQ